MLSAVPFAGADMDVLCDHISKMDIFLFLYFIDIPYITKVLPVISLLMVFTRE